MNEMMLSARALAKRTAANHLEELAAILVELATKTCTRGVGVVATPHGVLPRDSH